MKWEYIKEYITEMRDADGKLNQKETCQFILNLMGVIEKECETEEPENLWGLGYKEGFRTAEELYKEMLGGDEK